jgi:hypothetical protein
MKNDRSVSSSSTFFFLKCLQQFDVGQGGVHQLCNDVVRPQLLHHGIQNGRLADADFTGDDHEAVTVQQRELDVGHGARVLRGHVDEFRIRGQVERPAGQLEEFFVHYRSPR